VYTPSVYAASIPSKISDESAAQAADLALARNAFATDQIETALQAEGLMPEQIKARLALLTTEDVTVLRENPAQIKSAGISMSRRAWIITGVVVAAVAGGLALYGDDDEDSDDSDDGED
jgi:hypothetical protein